MDTLDELLPREKMLRSGIASLSDVELLALFLRTGTPGKDVMTLAKEILQHFGSLYGLLSADFAQFRGVNGIGLAKFAQLKGIAELARRYYSVRMNEESALLSPEMTREFLQSQLTGEEREIFLVIFLDAQHRVLQHSRLFSGTLNHVEVHRVRLFGKRLNSMLQRSFWRITTLQAAQSQVKQINLSLSA